MGKLTAADRAWAESLAAAHPLDGRAARARGNHLAAQNDEPEPGELTEADLVAADLTYLSTQQHRQQERDRVAHQLDVDRMRHQGAI